MTTPKFLESYSVVLSAAHKISFEKKWGKTFLAIEIFDCIGETTIRLNLKRITTIEKSKEGIRFITDDEKIHLIIPHIGSVRTRRLHLKLPYYTQEMLQHYWLQLVNQIFKLRYKIVPLLEINDE